MLGKPKVVLTAIAFAIAFGSACAGDDDHDANARDSGVEGQDGNGGEGGEGGEGGGGQVTDTGVGQPDTGGVDSGGGGDSGQMVAEPLLFEVEIENVSHESGLPTPLSPGVWAVLHGEYEVFEPDAEDRGMGLAMLAEDGDPSQLAAALQMQAGVSRSGVFDTPSGASGPGVVLPGESYAFELEAEPGDRLFAATMFVQSNDLFYSPDPSGVSLFDSSDLPLEDEDITLSFHLWDAGSEANEAPGSGPNQAPRQAAPNTGYAEGVVRPFTDTTRALPVASELALLSVEESGGEYTITIENISAQSAALQTPLAPVFFAVHESTWQLFAEGSPAGDGGLQALAEDGSPAELLETYAGNSAVHTVGAQTESVENPDVAGPIAPGEHYRFEVTPHEHHRFLSIAAMVVESNDAFLAFGPEGVALLDEDFEPRPAAEVQAELNRKLAIWDAGTEANEVPGAGSHQPLRQPAANTGPDDADHAVRRYADATNDLDGEELGGFLSVNIERGASQGSFDVSIENTSGNTAFAGLFTPVIWALHNGDVALVQPGSPASPGLQSLAEDGDGSGLLDELKADPAVLAADIAGDAPVEPGESLRFSVTPTSAARYLHLASMIVPSNDTFFALGSEGIALLDDAGNPRPLSDINADIVSMLSAWDAGTEANQAGAAGPDQAPRQSAPNTGASEGSGQVRRADDHVWGYPAVDAVIRVTVRVRP